MARDTMLQSYRDELSGLMQEAAHWTADGTSQVPAGYDASRYA